MSLARLARPVADTPVYAAIGADNAGLVKWYNRPIVMVSWGFDAYLKRQFVTESININRLTDHSIWSTIKTLPATLELPVDKVVDKVCALIVSDNLIKWRNRGSF